MKITLRSVTVIDFLLRFLMTNTVPDDGDPLSEAEQYLQCLDSEKFTCWI